MSEPVIRIHYGDWLDEYMQAEPDVSTEQKLIDALKGATSAQVARWAIVARERGEAPEDLIKPNKLLLLGGTQADIASKYAAQKRRVQLENGKKIDIRAYVGPVAKEEDSEASTDSDADPAADFEAAADFEDQDDNLFLVGALSAQGLERALYYLHHIVPGYVYGRLEIIAANRGDVQAAAQELIGQIERMVERLE